MDSRKPDSRKPNEWLAWAGAEALARTGSITTVKGVGLSFGSLGEGVLSTLIIGFVQMVGSALVARAQSFRIWLGARFFLLCALFGASSTVQTVIPFVAFGAQADLTLYLFIVVALSIVPGAIIDAFFFGNKFGWRSSLGIASAIVGGYVMFGLPSLQELGAMPWWISWAFLAMFLFAANQGLTKALAGLRSDVPDTVKAVAQNVTIGAVTLGLCAAALPLVATGAVMSVLVVPAFIIASVVIGLFVVTLIMANLMAYQRGAASIPIKNVVVTGAFLLLSALSGYLFFEEALAAEKFIGIALYVVAYFLIGSERK